LLTYYTSRYSKSSKLLNSPSNKEATPSLKNQITPNHLPAKDNPIKAIKHLSKSTFDIFKFTNRIRKINISNMGRKAILIKVYKFIP